MEENKNVEKELLDEKNESLQEENLEDNLEEDLGNEESKDFDNKVSDTEVIENVEPEDNLGNLDDSEENEELDSKDKKKKSKEKKKKKNKESELNLEEDSKQEVPQEKQISLNDIAPLSPISYDEILFSEDKYTVDDVIKTLKKEMNDLSKEDNDNIASKYNEHIEKLYNSKYKDCYEIYGVLIYYSFKLNKDLNYHLVLDNLDHNGQILSYIYAIMITNNTKEKGIKKSILKELHANGAYKTELNKVLGVSKNKKVLFEYSEASKKKGFKKYLKVVSKYAKKQEAYDSVAESLLRYTFKAFEYLLVKKGNKFYNEFESKFSDDLRIYALIKIAKGFGKIGKFKTAKHLFEKVLTLDNKNFEALEGIFLAENKCNYLEELAYKTNIDKAKGFSEFIEKANGLEEDKANKKVSTYVEINKKQKEDKIDDILTILRKHISVISFSSMLILCALTTFLNGSGLKVLFYISVAIFVGASFITRNIKKHIVSIIIKTIIGLGILLGGILFLFKLF